jgi:hypothetical protein
MGAPFESQALATRYTTSSPFDHDLGAPMAGKLKLNAAQAGRAVNLTPSAASLAIA